MARILPLRSRRHTAGVGLVLTLALTSAAVLAASASIGSASERDRVGTHETDDRVIVCESGVISHGDVDTSSAVATRVPSGALVPAGCREG
jgi:hypothetical protein